MGNKNKLTYEQKMLKALDCLPNPIEDNKHRIFIVFSNNRSRSNETRFEHIINPRHELRPNDIRRITKAIKSSILRKDKERKGVYNLYVPRDNYSGEYIKIILELDFKKSNTAYVKTMFIVKNLK